MGILPLKSFSVCVKKKNRTHPVSCIWKKNVAKVFVTTQIRFYSLNIAGTTEVKYDSSFRFPLFCAPYLSSVGLSKPRFLYRTISDNSFYLIRTLIGTPHFWFLFVCKCGLCTQSATYLLKCLTGFPTARNDFKLPEDTDHILSGSSGKYFLVSVGTQQTSIRCV